MSKHIATAMKLSVALDNIGRTNGHKPPDSQDPMDAVLHEYLIAATGASYFDKRKKLAREELEMRMGQVAETSILNMKADVTKTSMMQRAAILKGQVYTLNVSVKSSGEMLDERLLRVALLKKFSADEVEELINTSKKPRAVSTTFEVVES